MMKQIIFLLTVVFSGFLAFAQPNFGVNKTEAEPCYKRSESKSKTRYTEWECGKIAGIVNCNEKLEMSPNGKQVVTSSAKMPFTGTCETCHNNGILERRVQFVNGYANGIDTTFYASGCIKVIRSHLQGVENGTWTYFNDSTQIPAWERHYTMGELQGLQLNFNTKGDTVKAENYVTGVLNGVKKTYDLKGRIITKSNYVKGVLEGPFLTYNTEGKIIEELTFKQGKKNGVLTYYYDDGTLMRTENWNMGVRNGEFKTLYYDQSIQSIEQYKNGQKEGRFEERFYDAKMKRWAIYKKDVLVEEHVFDEQGREIKTFGGTASSGKEDDAMPTTAKEKKKKEKKEKPKKEKKPKK